jgi:FkbM family methyltransferase
MRLRGRIKKLVYGTRPFYRGAFPYFEQQVHFPRGSHIFENACHQGIYEQNTLQLLLHLIGQSGTYIDIGANIGLLSVPVLARRPEVKVISIEASPTTLSFLKATRDASPHRDRWSIVGSAVGEAAGSTTFWAARPENGAFDGLKNTGRGGEGRTVVVDVLPLDDIWRSAGSPKVSVVKVDVEGGETGVMRGSRALIERDGPAFVIEWSRANLPAYGIEPGYLLTICRDIGYRAYAIPGLIEIGSETTLRLAMFSTETFVLVRADGWPEGQCPP